jgi:arylsulfatase A-like enzyme
MAAPRNVLLIIADQFRADCVGAAGNPVIRTPHLDQLAAEGTLFTHAFVQTAPCGPSRMSIHTGRYLCSTRVVNNMTPLADAEENLAMYLRGAGYAPGLLGYNDYAVDPRTLPAGDPRTHELNYENVLPGYDWLYQHEYHSPAYFAHLRARGYPEDLCGPAICEAYDVPSGGPGEHLPLHYPAKYREEDSEAQFLTSKTVEAIRERADAGWVLNVNYIKPHPPCICPAPYHEMYDPAAMPPPNRRPEELEDPHPYYRLMHRKPQWVEEGAWRESRACYYGMVSEIDACVGRLLQALKESGQYDHTLIVFTSDHGEYLGDHYLTDKGHFYDATMRVPMLVRDPSRAADATRGRRLRQFVESVDIAPTILEYLGVSVPELVQGRSMLGLVHGRLDTAGKPAAFLEYDFRHAFHNGARVDPDECLLWVCRSARFKYAQFGLESMPPLLFDLETDPGEQHNLAHDASSAPAVAACAQQLLRWRMKHEDQRMEHWAAPKR